MIQGVDIQLGMAIDSAKATLAVKRRLACEMVKYWQQVYFVTFNTSFKAPYDFCNQMILTLTFKIYMMLWLLLMLVVKLGC